MGLDIIIGKAEKLDGRDPKAVLKMIDESYFTTTLRYHQVDDDDAEFLEAFKDFIFESEEEIYDINKLLSENGYTFDDVDHQDEDYAYQDDGFHSGDFRFIMKDGNTLTFNNAPITTIPCKGILFNEIGYQRKGANQEFYSDDMWSSKPVIKKDTLIDHWNRYFSGNGNTKHKGGIQLTEDGKITVEGDVPFGFGVEYGLNSYENRKRFQINIVDKFVEGETFVIYC